jgi:hypothetical protein
VPASGRQRTNHPHRSRQHDHGLMAQGGFHNHGRAAAYLLRLQAIYQRHHRYLPQQDFFPGKVNLVADLTTRSWETSDFALVSLLNLHFPQTQPWTLCILPKEIYFALTSALLRERTKPESLLNDPKHKTSIGNSGTPSAWKMESTHSCAPGPT